jgi:hypothetical protein
MNVSFKKEEPDENHQEDNRPSRVPTKTNSTIGARPSAGRFTSMKLGIANNEGGEGDQHHAKRGRK